jgi:hypothetical protein
VEEIREGTDDLAAWLSESDKYCAFIAASGPHVGGEITGNLLSWDYPILGFIGWPVSRWRPQLSSLFPEFYDRALEQLVGGQEYRSHHPSCACRNAGAAAIVRREI